MQSVFVLNLPRATMLLAILLAFITLVNAQPKKITKTVSGHQHPVYPPDTTNIIRLKKAVEPLKQMSLPDVIKLVPEASGIFYVGCPNCNGGAQEMNVLSWQYGIGDKVRCNYCQMEFPNEKFPNNREHVIIAPSGKRQVYRYHENAEGRQFYFEPKAWYDRWSWIQNMADQMATVWLVTQDKAYADRAAAITGRFAQVFPDYAIRFSYPHAKVKFYPANQKWPYAGMQPYRGAKWNWWGYNDIPVTLAKVYDVLNTGYDWKRLNKLIGKNTDLLITRDLLRLGYDVTAANPEIYTNMSPGMYRSMIQMGRILEDPLMVQEGLKRFREFFSRGFFADGWWKEGSTSYHDMTINGLKSVATALDGYTVPATGDNTNSAKLNLAAEMPLYEKALNVSREAVLPNGRKIPLNDTWWHGRGQKTNATVSRLWPVLGNAALGTGTGANQIMLNVNWSGNYGHAHYDNGSIILYGAGQEILSDIGYTHTKYRGWTIHTASHNTVVIDQVGQDAGTHEKPVTGHLQFYDDTDSHVKAIDVDASPAYAVAQKYRRRLIMVHAAPGRDYVIDRFEVEGGQDHDWFLHGMCEQEGQLETSIPLNQSLASLVPAWGGKALAKNQYDTDNTGKQFHAYAYLREVKSGPAAKLWTATWRYDSTGLRSHILSQAGTQAYRFRSPSVRLAAEDENKLDNFMRTGIMQRSSGRASTFMAVHEPFRQQPWIESVQTVADELVVRYTLNGKKTEDRIKLTDTGFTVISSAGWQYHSGQAHSGQVQGLEQANGKWRLKLDRNVPPANYVRLELGKEKTLYYPVKNVAGQWLELTDDPGFTLNASTNQVQFYTFPQNQYTGPVQYTVFVPTTPKP